MSRHVFGRHYYSCLSSHERFALLLEAMSRRDDAEADRLEDTCPTFLYRAEDQAFRQRMRRAYMIASRVCLNMRAGLAQLRLARVFRDQADCFALPVVRLAQQAFLYGREYGRCQAGAIDRIEVPDTQALDRELAQNEELVRHLDEITQLAGDALRAVAGQLVIATGKLHASDLLSQWEGFGLFCRESLGVEPLTLMAVFGLEPTDPTVEVREDHPDASVNPQVASGWAECWRGNWKRRFGSK